MLCRMPLLAVLFTLVMGQMLSISTASAQIFTDMFGVPISDGPVVDDDQPRTQLSVRKSFPVRAFCVRSCDGRYFSVASGEKNTCKAMCPGAETKLYKGGSIETAFGPDGKPYTKAKNAFRYRNEFVASCSCVPSGSTGLSHVSIEDDSTIRSGDIVADATGLLVATGSGSRATLRPITKARLRAEKLPAVAVR